jgi:hypothetical protein
MEPNAKGRPAVKAGEAPKGANKARLRKTAEPVPAEPEEVQVSESNAKPEKAAKKFGK